MNVCIEYLMVGVYNKSLTKMFDTHRSLSFKAARFVRPSRASKFSIPSRSVFSKETSGRTTSYICYGKGRNMENEVFNFIVNFSCSEKYS